MMLRLVLSKLSQSSRLCNARSISTNGKLIDASFGLNVDQQSLQSLAYDFAVKEMRPQRRHWDQQEVFPVDCMRKAAALGFGGIYIPVEDGGSGLSRLDTSIIFEALSQGCTSTAAYISIHNMCCWIISEFGNQNQKDKYLPNLISMQRFSSYCLTEPDFGSDAGNIKTRAEKTGDYYVINGSKAFISGSQTGNVLVLMCRTGGDGPKGISCFIIDTDESRQGLSFGRKEKKLGWNSHPARMVNLDNVKVPASNLLGREGEGFNIAMKGLNGGRTNIASCSLGAAQWALEETIEYTSGRKQFGQKIIDFQNTQFELASLATKVWASRLMVREAAKAIDANKDSASVYAAAAKLAATDDCFQVIDRCLQLFGGYGYLYDYPVAQLLRDTRVHRILEGTNEIMKVIIARSLLSE